MKIVAARALALVLGMHFATSHAEEAKTREKAFSDAVWDFQAQKYEDAISKLVILEKQVPGSAEVLNLLGAAYVKTKNYSAALEAFGKASSADPTFFPPRFNTAETYFLQQQYEEALKRFNALLQANPTTDILLFKVLICHLFLDQLEEAQKILERIRISGESPVWYYSQAAFEIKNGNKSKAKRLVSSARLMYPGSTGHYDETFAELGWQSR